MTIPNKLLLLLLYHSFIQSTFVISVRFKFFFCELPIQISEIINLRNPICLFNVNKRELFIVSFLVMCSRNHYNQL